jgi:uncharacterized membrane protein required for colicin V production
MLSAFAEAIRATTQPCTLLLLALPLTMAVITRGRWAPFLAMCVGAVLGGWLFIANVVALSETWLRLSGVVVASILAIVLAVPALTEAGWADRAGVRAAAAGAVTFIATLWWRPCIGSELGTILTASRHGLAAQLPGITAYMLGAMVPVLAVVLIIRAIDPPPPRAQVLSRMAGLLGLVIAGALAIGRHDDLVTALTRWTTS